MAKKIYFDLNIVKVLDTSSEIVFSSENFVFKKITQNLEIERWDDEQNKDITEPAVEIKYEVQSKGQAEFHSIKIEPRYNYRTYYFEQPNIYIQSYEDRVEITKGIRMSPSVNYDIPTTKAYIELLQSACDFAERVEKYLAEIKDESIETTLRNYYKE